MQLFSHPAGNQGLMAGMKAEQIKGLLWEFWNQSETRHGMRLAKGEDNHRNSKADFEKHFKLFEEGKLPEKPEDY